MMRRAAFVITTPVLAGAGLSALGPEALGLGPAVLQLSGCAEYVFTGWCGASLVHRNVVRDSSAPLASTA